MLNVSCTLHDTAMSTGCIFVYDSSGDGTMDYQILMNLPKMVNTAEVNVIINCDLNRLNFTFSAVAGTTLFSPRMLLDCPVHDTSFNLLSSRGKQTHRLLAILTQPSIPFLEIWKVEEPSSYNRSVLTCV